MKVKVMHMEERTLMLGKNPITEDVTITAIDTLFYFEFSDKFKDRMSSFPPWEMIYADRGRCRMIADGKELTVQRIDADQIPYFNAMAKKYGVMFVAVRDKQNPDGKCDIMFRLEDSARVNRIFDRLAISEHPDVAHIKSEIIRSKEERKNPQKARNRSDKGPSPSARTSPTRSATGETKPSVRKALQAIKKTRAAGKASPAKQPRAKQKSR